MSKKSKAGNADEDAMALASSHSQEELEKMLATETEALGGMVEDGDNMGPGMMRDDSSHSGEADSSDDDI